MKFFLQGDEMLIMSKKNKKPGSVSYFTDQKPQFLSFIW